MKTIEIRIGIEQEVSIVVDALKWDYLHAITPNKKDMKAILRVLEYYMGRDELKEWKKEMKDWKKEMTA